MIGFIRSPEKEKIVSSFCDEVEHSLDLLLDRVDCLLVCVAPKVGTADAYRETYLYTAERIRTILSQTSLRRLRQILYTSSASVYGEHAGAWVSEMDELFSLTEQAKILVETENLFLAIQACRVAIFRIGELVGPGREISDKLKARLGLPFPGTGEAFVNLTPLDLLIRGLDFAKNGRLAGIFNLCSNEHPTRKSLYERVAKEYQLPPILWNASISSPHGGNKRLCCDKLKSLGFLVA